MSKKLICITDDCELFRLGVKTILETTNNYDIIETSSSNELFSYLKSNKKQPDVILLDVKLKKFGSLNGIEIAKYLKQNHPNIKIIILTSYDEKEILKNSLDAGVEGFLPKETITEELLDAIESVLSGQNYLGKNTSFQALNYAFKVSTKKLDSLTKTEFNIYLLICKGFLNNQIADKLHISIHTVETHKSNIKNKLLVKSDIDFLRIAIEENIEEIMKYYMIQGI